MTNEELKQLALGVRKDILEMIYKAGSGHPGGSLSSTEILVALYFEVMGTHDRFFLSNGHVCPALYSVMAEKGLIDKKLLNEYTSLGSKLQGHPERNRLKGIENTSGPLGMGLAQAAGFAVALKLDSLPGTVYCLTSDGEHDEGNHWEAVMFAAKYKLDNLVQIVDRNNIQIEGTTEEIMPLGDLGDKYRAFGWAVSETDGHNFEEILMKLGSFKEGTAKPKVLIANTVFGKGVSFMQGNPDWHARAPDKEEYSRALNELK